MTTRTGTHKRVRIAEQSLSTKVTVACKLPNGLELRLYKFEEQVENLYGGGKHKFTIAVPTGDMVRLRGPSIPWGHSSPDVIHGVGLTEGVDRDFFAEWLRQNVNTEIVKNGLVYAYEDRYDTVAHAKEHRKELSGLEPLDVRMVEEKDDKGRRVEVLADKRIDPLLNNPNLTPLHEGERPGEE
jgi:hypothetical protein